MILNKFKNIIKKYSSRNEDILLSENIFHEVNGVVLTKSSDALFDFDGVLIEEINNYCKSQGYNIDKILFVYNYELDFSDNRSVNKDDKILIINKNYNMEIDSKISIIEHKGKVVARVFIGAYTNIGRKK